MHRRAFSTGPSSLSESAGSWNECLDVLRDDLWRGHRRELHPGLSLGRQIGGRRHENLRRYPEDRPAVQLLRERKSHSYSPRIFRAQKGQRRRAGTGCVTQINKTLWEGRYSPIGPDGKRRTRNIYAHSEAECERLLAEMIVQMKMELTAEKERLAATPIKAS